MEAHPAEVVGWTDFLVASAGAIAALVGLLFVSLSINLAKIIDRPELAGRGTETVILLAGTLVEILLLLVPHLSAAQIGATLALAGLPTWIMPMVIQYRSLRTRSYLRLWHALVRGILHQLATAPALLAVLSLCGWWGGGLHWFALSVIMSIIAAIANAWVLLVEILR